MKNVLVVPSLSVHAETGPALYPAEGGSAAIFAIVDTADSALTDVLSRLAQSQQSVVLRCAMLDVTGRITKREINKGSARFVVNLEDMTYKNPQQS